MTPLAEWGRRFWYLLNRRRFEAALQRDMEAHREAMADARRFGSLLRHREDASNVWGWRWLDDGLHDLRFAMRTLRRAPAFALIIIGTLALATGATTAMFSVVNGVVLQPLPFDEPARLVQVYGRSWREDRGASAPDPIEGPVASPELEEYTRSASFEGLAGYEVRTAHLDGRDGRERLPAALVDPNLFTVLGVEALAGRTFRAGDSRDVAVISERLWRARFSADRSLIGRAVTIDDQPRTIVGVMPDAFQFPYAAASILRAALPESRTEVWLPMEPLRAAGSATLRRGRLSVVGRLKPGVTPQQAGAELTVIASRVEARYAGTRIRIGVRLAPLTEVVVGRVRQSLWMLFAAVGLVLAAACANVANLLLARMAVRTREVVTRAALGAGRWRLVRQFLAESLLLALAGGVLGAFVARWGAGVLMAAGAARMPRAHEVALDWRAFAFLLLVCVSAAVLFGLAPAWTAARVDARSATGEAGGRATMGRGYGRLRDALVVVEVALAFVLAVGAALVMREAARLERTPTGMREENVLTLHLTPRAAAADYEAIAARVAALPGVLGAGMTQMTPLQNWGWEADFDVRGRPSIERRTTDLRYVTATYFSALGIPIISGRGFLASDTAGSVPVVLVNEAFARRYFRGENPVGIELNRGRIIGVAGDVRQVTLDRPAAPELYYPVAQNVATASDIGMSLLVRAAQRPDGLTEAIRAAIREVNPRLAIFNVRSLQQVRADSLWELNLYRWLIGVFAALTLVLAAMGLYGVMTYSAQSRLREFAVRLALGSAPSQVTRLIFARGLRLSLLGLAAGLAATLAAEPVLRHVSAALSGDPVIYALVGAVLMVIALVACAVPARRAASVDPMTALRHD
jgi:putative ABC transport system permease protein